VKIPRWLTYLVVVLVVLSWVPLVLILRARQVKSPLPRIHIVQDMDNQPKFGPQSRNRLFADLRAMRPPVAGTVARGELREDDRLYRGAAGEAWIDQIPVPVTEQLLQRGRERYEIFCSPCHGLAGYGDGMVSKRAEALQEGSWTPPPSFHTDLVRGRQVGHLYNTITNGVRSMPAYGPQIAVEDRWAIVAYLRALQRSQHATVEDVPPELRAQLR
jgi:mono/diheme cytochrome c family protein